jgi:outer membrane usher protein
MTRSLLSIYCFLVPSVILADGLYFDPYTLDPRGGGVAADLEVFSRGQQLPGVYRVDIFLNRTRIANRDMTFVMDKDVLRPQLTVSDLKEMGVNTAAFPLLNEMSPGVSITDIGAYIPEATTHFEFSHQRLDVLVPQASLTFEARNAVNPTRWDQGISAVIMNYNLTGSHSSYDGGGGSDSAFFSLGTGVNIGAWRLRNNSTYTYTQDSRSQRSQFADNYDPGYDNDYDDDQHDRSRRKQKNWQSLNTYLQRDIQSLGGQLTLGETNTPGTLFESMQFRGAQISSDDSMLADSQRGFAPIVRGIAKSSAQVTIRQNGYVIYQTYVAPGPYAIRDIYATSGSGDLEVTLREENGSEHTYVQPYSSVPLMQREGRLRYEFSAGQYRSQLSGAREPGFGQGGLIYGLSNITTVYGGMTGSPDYTSAVAGVGQGLGSLGSVSFDVTQANTTLQDKTRHQGQSFRMQYAKDVFQSGTTFTLAGYRYSTSGFYDFKEANEFSVNARDEWRRGVNKRSRMQVQVSQTMGDYGSLYLSGYQQNYWGQTGSERTFGVGYNTNWNGMTFGVNLSETQTPYRSADRQYAFSVQIPLDRLLSKSWASFNTQMDSQNRNSQTATVSGLALENNNLSYSVRESLANQGRGNSGGANATYKGTYGNTQAGYSYTNESKQYTGGIQGGLIVHPDGVTLSQPLGETVTLVKAPGASGVRVQNQVGVSTDWRGYAVVPYATTYRENRVALATDSFADDVDILDTVQVVVPTRGAVVRADFKPRTGSRVLVSVRHQGNYLPFGAAVTLRGAEEEIATGIVGDNGEVYLTAVPDQSSLHATWAGKTEYTCIAPLSLTNASVAGGVKIVEARCEEIK